MLLHAASFVHRGRGVLVTGWQKGGKTETLLPFTAAGADYVADEWTVVGGAEPGHVRAVERSPGSGTGTCGEVPEYWDRITPAQRARLRVWRGYRQLYRALPRHDHVRAWPVRLLRAGQRRRRRGPGRPSTAIPPARLFGDRVWHGRAPLDRVFLPVLGQDDAMDRGADGPKTVAQRMVSSLEFERAPLTTAYQQFRFAFPDRVSAALDTVRERELALLVDALDGPARLRDPPPVPGPLHDLCDAADPYCQ